MTSIKGCSDLDYDAVAEHEELCKKREIAERTDKKFAKTSESS
jgi:hypothetical protein